MDTKRRNKKPKNPKTKQKRINKTKRIQANRGEHLRQKKESRPFVSPRLVFYVSQHGYDDDDCIPSSLSWTRNETTSRRLLCPVQPVQVESVCVVADRHSSYRWSQDRVDETARPPCLQRVGRGCDEVGEAKLGVALRLLGRDTVQGPIRSDGRIGERREQDPSSFDPLHPRHALRGQGDGGQGKAMAERRLRKTIQDSTRGRDSSPPRQLGSLHGDGRRETEV